MLGTVPVILNRRSRGSDGPELPDQIREAFRNEGAQARSGREEVFERIGESWERVGPRGQRAADEPAGARTAL